MSETPLLQRITPADHRIMPWKNGLGTTREIAIDPPGATMADTGFRWRLSIADVPQSGPFSAFPGIDRTIMVIEGNGMVLSVAGRPPRRLDTCFMPYEFSGDAATDCELIDGPIRDFNLMVNRSFLSARTELHRPSTPERVEMHGDVVLLHLFEGAAAFARATDLVAGAAGDTIVCHRAASGSGVDISPRTPLVMAVMQLLSHRRH